MNKTVIIGGVAGGASCAARLRRLDEEAVIVMLERGEYISYANCGLPYHVGDTIKSRDALLLQTPEAMKKKFEVDVRVKNEVVAIDREKKTVLVKRWTAGRLMRRRMIRWSFLQGLLRCGRIFRGLSHRGLKRCGRCRTRTISGP